MVRSIALGVLVFAACGGHSVTRSDPAWPAMQEPETDGGESLAPRQTSAAVAAVEADDDDEAAAADDDKPEDTPADTPETPAPPTETPAAPSIDEIPITEEIVIEIEE